MTAGFEYDLVLEPRRSARRAWWVAGVASSIAFILALLLLASLPLRKTEIFTVLVDRTTGEAEKVVQVAPVGLAEEEAVKQALLVGYITDRESYMTAGIQEQLESVQRRSAGNAEASLVRLWTNTNDNEDYPPALYGVDSEVTVKVKQITFLNPEVAQVRFTKTLRKRDMSPVARAFTATVGFEFAPAEHRRLERVWENPLGFTVTQYRVDAETMGDG